MKMSKKWPRASALLLVMLLCFFILTVPAYAKTDESKAITASSDPIEEAVVPTAEPALSEPVKETEPEAAVPLTPEGNLTIVDDLEGEQTEDKQFITVKTKAGNTFYLIIDRAGKENNVYFLNLVDERDLLALMSDEEKEEVPTPTPEIIYVTPEPTAVPAPTPVVTEPEPEKKPDQMTAIIALAAIVLLGGGGAIFMVKNKGKGGKNRADNDFVLDDDDDEPDEEEPNQE